MRKRFLPLIIAAGTALCFGADSETDSLNVHLAARGASGLVEMLPELSRERGTLEGFRGCTNGTDECDDASKFTAGRAYPVAGESLVLFVAGTGKVDAVRIQRNGVTAIEYSDLTAPAEIVIGEAAEGETVLAVVQRGSESVEFSVTAGETRSAKASARASWGWGWIVNYVYIPGGVCRAGWYEVIQGSGTGGRCRSGYTDRAQRGERIWTFYEGSAYARVGWRYYGSRRVYRVGPVNLPHNLQFTVSLDPHDDNLYTFIEGITEVRIPIGTRP